MRKYSISKINIKIIAILGIALFTMCIGFGTNKSYAAQKSETYTGSNLNTTKYPGYKTLLDNLKSANSNWKIVLLYTGIDWEEAVISETQGHGQGHSPKNLVPSNNNNYKGSWLCPVCGQTVYDTGDWCCASEKAVAYMLDPRNSLNTSDVFQFLKLDEVGGAATDANLSKMVSGTFLNTASIRKAILDAANANNVSPYFLAARILQEQKSDGSSTLAAGKGYNGNYVGYYNVFSIGATGNDKATVATRALKTAYDNGWTSIEKSITGGTIFLKNKYIAIGQNTLYFQKFQTVEVSSGDYELFQHQYMQNILAAQNEGTRLRNYYSTMGITNSSFTFIVPLYENMPSTACARPSTTTPISIIGTKGTINANGGANIRAKANGTSIKKLDNGTSITLISKGTTTVGGYYWDKVMSSTGYYGYVARNYIKLTDTTNTTTSNYKVDGSYIKVAPGTKLSNISGATSSSSTFATGVSITLSGKSYSLVMLGDANPDGKISALDYIAIKNHIMGTKKITNGAKYKAADANSDGNVSALDYIAIKNNIMNGTKIVLK